MTALRRHDTAPVGGQLRDQDDDGEATTLLIGVLNYAGAGWRTTADAMLAATVAAKARERRRIAHEEIAHEIGRLKSSEGTVNRG